MSRPHNCRHRAWMMCGDINWCDEHEDTMSDAQIFAARKCPDWRWCETDALTMDEWQEPRPSERAVLDGQMRLEMEESE